MSTALASTLAALGFVGAFIAGLLGVGGGVVTFPLLFWEHHLVKPNDFSRVNRAFFDFNAYVSVGYFLITLGDVLLNYGFGDGR